MRCDVFAKRYQQICKLLLIFIHLQLSQFGVEKVPAVSVYLQYAEFMYSFRKAQLHIRDVSSDWVYLVAKSRPRKLLSPYVFKGNFYEDKVGMKPEIGWIG